MVEMSATMRPGMPKISVAQMRQQVQMMKGMDPKTMESMADLAKQMPGVVGDWIDVGTASPPVVLELVQLGILERAVVLPAQTNESKQLS